MIRNFALCALLATTLLSNGQADERYIHRPHAIDLVRSAHPNDPVKRDEHAALLNLAPIEEADFAAIQNGRWSDPATWKQKQVPTQDSRVVIPAGLSVILDSRLTDRNFEWVHVLGKLRLASASPTLLNVTTLLVNEEGILEIGEPSDPVAGRCHRKASASTKESKDKGSRHVRPSWRPARARCIAYVRCEENTLRIPC